METSERLSTVTEKQILNGRSLDLMRWISCLHQGDGREGNAKMLFELRYPRSLHLDLVMKSAIAPGTSIDATWAGPLAVMKPLTDAFLEYVRPRTLLGKIQNLRRVPFNISVAAQTAGGTYAWIGQGVPKPVGAAAYASVTLGVAKTAGMIVVAEELVKLSRPSAEVALRDELAAGLSFYLDTQFVDPAVAAVANVSPGSVTNGTTPIASSGGTAANALTDIKALIAAFTVANPAFEFAVLLMTPANAVALAVATGLPNLGAAGGVLFGVPVVTSTALGTNVVMVDAAGILFADDGGMDISLSRQATVQMDSAPDSPSTATTVMVSLWQMNLVGLRIERTINWKRGRLSAVKYTSGATYV